MGSDRDDDDEDEDEDDDEGSNQLPQVFIMNQVAQIKEGVDMEDIEGSVQKVVDDYLLQLRISRGQGMPGMDGMDYEDDDDEFEEDDEDDEDDDDEEMDTEYDPSAGTKGDDEEESDGDQPKTDL